MSKSLQYGLRLNLLDGVDECRLLLETVVENHWDIFFAGVIWPGGSFKANLHFEREVDRDLAYETARSCNDVIMLDTADRRQPLYEVSEHERRSGVDRRLKSGERVERPQTGRRLLAGETLSPLR